MVRMLYTCDVHGSSRCFKKLLNAARYNVYKTEVVMVSGDLTGKAIVPVVERPDGTYEAHTRDILGEDRIAKNQEELKALLEVVGNVGYYPMHMKPEEIPELRGDPKRLEALLAEAITSRIKEWLALAQERLKDKNVRLFMMPGNDDLVEVGGIIDKSGLVTNPEGKVIELDKSHEMISLGYSNPTPWKTFRELSEDELGARIDAMVAQLKKPENATFNFHVPPYDTPLDTAPVLDQNLRPTVVMGDLLRGPVGSKAVRAAIEKYQPLLGLHGHIHESSGEVRLGRTLCLNPGSEYAAGILRGYVLEITDKGLSKYARVEG